MRLFSEQGFRGASVAQIEAAAGLTPGAGGLYHHFGSKEDVLASSGQELDQVRASTIAALALGSLLSSRLLSNIIGVDSLGVSDDALVPAWVDMVSSMLTPPA